MRVLIACEFSQIVTRAFRDKGHEAYSCDILATEGNPEWHIQGDVLEILDDGWDLMMAFPPCTRLCNSGVRWLRERNLWDEMRKAAEFFKRLLKSPIKKACIENSIPHKYAIKEIGRRYDQIIQPWQFGHGESKATCLWLNNLPPLMATKIMTGREQRIYNMPKTPDRGHKRSVIFQGIADAMAEQWGIEEL
ncbi:hypothetical protein LCGC14_2018630 [marine sediment metagenome]|uniref:DNA cytosine methyltransferase n=1 Tax=marine sediment metagenome TaxID=412755 RepID=A0A0F9EYE3_9ZZZZ